MGTVSETLGKMLKQFREEQGISQATLAGMLKVSRPTISQIESGQRKISAEELLTLAKVLNVTIERLLGLEKEPTVMLQKGNKSSNGVLP